MACGRWNCGEQADEWGQSFTFVVNGRPIFCKGANWIPADSFATRVTPERYWSPLIAAAAATHQNMLRCWGGGYYESEAFYDLCDRYGLLVWQDFMFACACYPLHEEAFVEGSSRKRSSRCGGCGTGPAWRCGAGTTRSRGAGSVGGLGYPGERRREGRR